MKNLNLLVFACFFFNVLNAQIVFDGNITETEWGTALETSAGGPTSGFTGTNELNALYVASQTDDVFFAIAGDIEFGNRILLFIDSKSGGYTDGSFGRTDAPFGINNFNSGITFDAGFLPDYCLVIGEDDPFTAYYFDLFELNGTGSNSLLGNSLDADFGGNPIGSDNTRGFEATISKAAIGYVNGNNIQVMAMYISDAGFLSNQFLTIAGSGQGDYGTGVVDFASEPPNPFTIAAFLLPVELSSFEVELLNNQAYLKWETDSEINNKSFEIEHATNGKDFENIGTIEGKGSTLEKSDYSFIDINPNNGVNYYRLKQIDFNGNIEYSKIISVNLDIDSKIIIYPNPVSEKLIINKKDVENIDLQIFDMTGQLVFEKLRFNSSVSIDLSKLLIGNYSLIIRDSTSKNIIQQQQIIKN